MKIPLHIFLKEGGAETRTKKDYARFKAIDKKPGLVVGGAHLSPIEAYELSKGYASKGQVDLMFQDLDNRHNNRTVINIDPHAKPDYVGDITEDNLIARLNLAQRFTRVIFENLAGPITFHPSALDNAWMALQPNGELIIIPVNMYSHLQRLDKSKFIIQHYYSGAIGDSYVDTTRSPGLEISVPVAILKKITQQSAPLGVGALRPAMSKPATKQGKKIGRNDKCPCGSGKKYKVCHGVN